MTSRSAYGAEDSWIATVHRSEDDFQPLGTAVVIDERMVVTCAHVVMDNGRVMSPLPWVAFPMAASTPGQRREVVGVRLAERPHDLALLDLGAIVPLGVKAARLRCPRPEYLVGRGWSAFGFPEEETFGSATDVVVYGDHAEGRIDAQLAYGFVRLDADLRSGVRPGFSGSGLWSPDYDAVVGIVTHADGRGDGRAVTLCHAVRYLDDDRLSTLMKWSAGRASEEALAAWGWTAGQGGYTFRGRKAALTKITEWLDRDRTDRRVLVVTGAPGAGKSAVLGRVVITADPGIRAMLPFDDDAVWATQESVACSVHARGKTALEVATEIARAVSAELPQLPERLDSVAPAVSKALAEQGRGRFNIIIDALDEATRPADAVSIVTQIVRPLLRTCPGVQVVVGCRRRNGSGDLLGVFGDAVEVIDLDDATYFSIVDIERYALTVLQLHDTDSALGNPYTGNEVARPLATRIAELSRGNFLVAGLTAATYALNDQVPADPGELTSYSKDAEDALYQLLQRALERAPEAAGMPVSAALTALAFAEAPGLSPQLWSVATQALCGEALQPAQLVKLARSAGGSFVTESEGPVFQLNHQALSDALLRRRAQLITSVAGSQLKEDQRALTVAFFTYGCEQGWESAPPYLLRSLSHHAEPAGLLDLLLTDDEYLLYVDLGRLTPLAVEATTEAAKARAHLLRLTPYAVSAGPQERRALFSVSEALERLGDSFRGNAGPAPYRARWSTVTTHRERTLQEGHTGGVWQLCAFTLAGQTLVASAGEDEMVRVWNPVTGQQLRVLEGHGGAVNSVCGFTSADGQVLLASAGADAVVRIWDPVSGQQLRVLEGHGGAVNGVCGFTSADGQVLLASAGADAVVRIWDPVSGQVHQVLAGHTGGAWSVCALTSDDDRTLLASVGTDAMVRIWDPVTGQQQRAMAGHTGTVWWVCRFISDDGRSLLASAGDDEAIRVWDPASGQQHQVLAGHTGGAWSVCALTFDDAPALLASSSADAVVRLWDPATGQSRRSIPGHPGSIWSMCEFISDDGRSLLASAGDDSVVRLWDPATGLQLRTMDGHTGGAWSVCTYTTGDGRRLLACAGHDGVLRVWDPATGRLQQAIDWGTGEVWALCALTCAGRTQLAWAGDDSVVRLWDPATGESSRAMAGHTGTVWWMCAFTSADGRPMLASAADDEAVRVWDPATGDLLHALTGHTGGAWSVCAFTADDGRTLLASASADGMVRVWDPATGDLLHALTGHTGGIWSVCAFTAGVGRTLLASCADDATARIWDPMSGQSLQTIPVHLMPHVIREVDGLLVLGLSSGLLAIELSLDEQSEVR